MINGDDINFVDYHCHLDLYSDHVAQLAQCAKHGIATLTVTTVPKAWPRNVEFAEQNPYVRVALGLHPQLAVERKSELALFEKYLPNCRYVGEVGIDAGPKYYSSLAEQKRIFERILNGCVELGGKILSVHSVRSCRIILEMIERIDANRRCRVVLHWFSGSRSELKRAVELGCYFSVNMPMLQSDRGCLLVKDIPKDRLLTETDGPFTFMNNRPSQPMDVVHTVQQLAALLGCSLDDQRQQIVANLKSLERPAI